MMSGELIVNHQGGYRFLPGIEPYSCGVAAEPGFEVVHATLIHPLPWHEGLLAVRKYLEQDGRHHHALCGVELRCPEPHSFEGFGDFNRNYRRLLEEWQILVGSENPVARTNVSPVIDPPGETMLYAFSFTVPSEQAPPTFVIAGGGELRDGELNRDMVVRLGETSPAAMLEKAQRVVEIMSERLSCLGGDDLLSTINVYTKHPIRDILLGVILPGIPAAARRGVNWFLTRPPVQEIEFEMDMRGVRRELAVEL